MTIGPGTIFYAVVSLFLTVAYIIDASETIRNKYPLMMICLLLLIATSYRDDNKTKAKPTAEQIDKIKNLLKCKLFIGSTSWCVYSTKAKKLMAKYGKEPVILEFDKEPDGDQLWQVMKEITGQKTVPYIYIEGTFIGGYSDLKKRHDKGELAPLLERV